MFSLQTSFRSAQLLLLCCPFLDLCLCFHAPYFPDLLLLFLSHLDLFLYLMVAICPHIQSFFLSDHFQWWRLLGHFGPDFWWCCYLNNSPCLMGAHLHMSLLWWFLHLLHFQRCHHHARFHVLKVFPIIHFVSRRLCLWLGYLGSTQKLDTLWSFMAASP